MLQPFTFTGIPKYTVIFAFPYREDAFASSCYFVARRRLHGSSYAYRAGWAQLDHTTKKMAYQFTTTELPEGTAFGECFNSLANELDWDFGGW